MTTTLAVAITTGTWAAPPEAASAWRVSVLPKCPTTWTQAQHERYARKVFNRTRIVKAAKKRLVTMRVCQYSDAARINARRLVRRLRNRRKVRLALTPYRCGKHGRFAVPCGIVFRESRFNCRAKNPRSSAYGYYQLLDSWWGYLGRRPTCREQHRIAARLWRGGRGVSNWRLTA